MEMSKKVLDALNEQIRNELYSGYLYLSMAAWFEANNYPGAAHWMKLQAKEEYSHAMRIYDHICDRGQQPILLAIDKPPSTFSSMLNIFEMALEHEKKVTAMIENLCAIAQQEKDLAALAMLQWFVTEQVEEEKSPADIVAVLQKIGDKGNAIYMLDRQLAKREE